MTDELIAYLLDDLGPERRALVEQRLQSDAAWQKEFQRLRDCFASCGETCDGTAPDEAVAAPAAAETVEPPRDLVHKTCCFVERACGSAGPEGAKSAATLAPEAAMACGRRSSWSMADFAVGGGVLVVLGMLMMPALQESRGAARRLTCQNNLKSLGSGLQSYQQIHGRWLPTVGPGQSAAQYVAALAKHTQLSPEELAPKFLCPDSPAAQRAAAMSATVQIPTHEELASTFGNRARPAAVPWADNYAYGVGHRDDHGYYHYVKYTGSKDRPMLADAPEFSAHGMRSNSHAGIGYYVLSQGLDAPFRTMSDLTQDVDNPFLNDALQQDAGCNEDDDVLLRCDRQVSEMPQLPSSPIVPLTAPR